MTLVSENIVIVVFGLAGERETLGHVDSRPELAGEFVAVLASPLVHARRILGRATGYWERERNKPSMGTNLLMNRLSQLLLVIVGGFATTFLIAFFLGSQIAGVAAWVLFFALVVVSFGWLAIFTTRKARNHLFNDSHFKNISDKYEEDHTQDELSILRERYARGELTDGQFEQKLDRLLETDTRERATEWRKKGHEQDEENHQSESAEQNSE